MKVETLKKFLPPLDEASNYHIGGTSMPLSLSKKALQVKPSSTLAITAKAKEMKNAGVDIVGFVAGEPDFNTPENINKAAIRAIEEGFTRYTPAAGIMELRKAVSDKFKSFNKVDYDWNQVVISNGGKHSLTNIFEVLINPGDEVIIPVPYWLTYPEIVRLTGGIPVYVEGKKENGYRVTAKEIKELVTDKTKALIINTPSNPTGMIYSKEELEDIAQVAIDKDFYVVSDEMYEYLTYDGHEHISIASLNDEIYKRTITCSGVSKSYAMTGWRIGYTGSSLEIAKLMGSVQSHQTSNPCSIAQKAALEAISGTQLPMENMVVEFEKRKKYIYERISKIPYIEALEPEGAFYIFVDLSNILTKEHKGEKVENAEHAAKILLEDYKVVVIPCADFGSPNFLRLSYAISKEAIEKGMDRVQKFVENLS